MRSLYKPSHQIIEYTWFSAPFSRMGALTCKLSAPGAQRQPWWNHHGQGMLDRIFSSHWLVSELGEQEDFSPSGRPFALSNTAVIPAQAFTLSLKIQ